MGESDDPNAAAYDSRPLNDAYRAVPELGRGRRWYDLPYRAVDWTLTSRVGRRLPRRARRALSTFLNFWYPFNEHDRNCAWTVDDPRHTLVVDPDEEASLPDIWVVEFFPPSELGRLRRAIARRGWDRERTRYGIGQTNADLLDQARNSRGWQWWRIGTVVQWDAAYFQPEAKVSKLPSEFQAVELVGLTVGPSLTVVVAHVQLSEVGRAAVDTVWHGPHEPRLVRQGRRFLAEDRLWAGMSRTQHARKRLHELARRWLRDECPGLFASSGTGQLLIDLVLLRSYDPTSADQPDDRARHDALRALGILDDPYRLTSPAIPGLLLEQVDDRLAKALPGTATWTLWGQLGRASEGEALARYGSEPVVAVGARYDEAVRNIAVRVGLLELTRLRRRQNAAARDSARARYRRFRRGRAVRLRDDFLRTSLDTAMLMRDIKQYGAVRREDAPLRRSLHPRIAQEGAPWPEQSEDFDRDLAQRLTEEADELAAFDADYRAIMGTAATLGMAATALLTQRLALLIAFSSLAVAVVAFASK